MAASSSSFYGYPIPLTEIDSYRIYFQFNKTVFQIKDADYLKKLLTDAHQRLRFILLILYRKSFPHLFDDNNVVKTNIDDQTKQRIIVEVNEVEQKIVSLLVNDLIEKQIENLYYQKEVLRLTNENERLRRIYVTEEDLTDEDEDEEEEREEVVLPVSPTKKKEKEWEKSENQGFEIKRK